MSRRVVVTGMSGPVPTKNLEEVDARCAPLDHVRDAPRALDVELVVSNNFAFGGVNTSLVFRRLDG